jgi:sterol desaturase/sphingolipid hydroxylase (fatty acid hydroxylase superfamily)
LLLNHASAVQVLLFGLVLCGCWLVEWLYRPEPVLSKLRHTGFNSAFMLGALPVQVSLSAVSIAAANWATLHHVGLLYLLPHSDSPWLKYGLMFLVLDLLDYTYHVIAHRSGTIWRLHLVHHSDRAVDVSTTFREHPAETGVRVTFLIGAILICGASLQVLILRQTMQTVSNVLQHTKFDLPPVAARIFGWVFVTPNLHHIHHHERLPGTNCNYGDVFSVWDRLFGTFVDFPAKNVVFGLDTVRDGVDTSYPALIGWNDLVRWRTARIP